MFVSARVLAQSTLLLWKENIERTSVILEKKYKNISKQKSVYMYNNSLCIYASKCAAQYRNNVLQKGIKTRGLSADNCMILKYIYICFIWKIYNNITDTRAQAIFTCVVHKARVPGTRQHHIILHCLQSRPNQVERKVLYTYNMFCALARPCTTLKRMTAFAYVVILGANFGFFFCIFRIACFVDFIKPEQYATYLRAARSSRSRKQRTYLFNMQKRNIILYFL